jgi:zinc protease
MMRHSILVTLAAGLAALGVSVLSAADIFPYKVSERVLPNGLKVVVIPFNSPGTVALYTVVRTGSRNEVEPGHSGFAHFFEHMMFRGTPRYPQARYNDVLKSMGADSNASTSDDLTQYYIVGPARELPKMLEIEGDRFTNLKYTEDVFRTEALAVLGEYNKNASNPARAMQEKLRELAFEAHTYKHTTMGFVADIKAMPGYYDYSLNFFDRFYRPENAIVLVVGDVQPERVFADAAKYYGDWKPGYKAAAISVEPPQKEPKSAILAWPNPTRPYLMVGYKTPAFSTTNTTFPTLDVISELLFSESSPLYQELVVDKQWVDFIGGNAVDHRDPYLFTISARVKSENLLPGVEEVIGSHVKRLAESPVDSARLARVKSHLRYQFALQLDSPASVAALVAHYLSLTGKVETINELFVQYDAVTPADVQRVIREVFRPSNGTTVTLTHTPQGGGGPR